MPELAHSFVEQTTRQTNALTTYEDVSGCTIASGNFTAGKQYLLYVQANVDAPAFSVVGVRVKRGSTAFADSEFKFGPIAAANRASYGWYHVWTAVSGEAITLQSAGIESTVGVDNVTMVAIKLSDDLTENTDWFFAEDGADLALTTTPQNGASITFTPAEAGKIWLVLTYSQIDITTAANASRSLMDRSGEASSSTPDAQWDVGTSANEQPTYLLARTFTLGAASNTFREQSASVGANAHIRLHSKVFALNLNKMRNAVAAYTDGSVSLSTTNYATLLQSLSITPDIQGDVWIGGYWGFDANDRVGRYRLQVDDVDQPDTQTSDAYTFQPGEATADVPPMNIHTVENLTAAAHTVDLDGSASGTGANGQNRCLWAVTMELPSGVIQEVVRVNEILATARPT